MTFDPAICVEVEKYIRHKKATETSYNQREKRRKQEVLGWFKQKAKKKLNVTKTTQSAEVGRARIAEPCIPTSQASTRLNKRPKKYVRKLLGNLNWT